MMPAMTSAIKVKICGLATEAAVDAAMAGGADFIGLVFFPASPRNVPADVAKRLAARARGRAKIVALLVDPDDALIESVVAGVEPDLLQLHGEETPDRVREIRRRWGKGVIKAVKVRSAGDAREAERYCGAADLILFDARAPESSDRPGGHGAPFDWRILDGVQPADYMLSGGLTPDNVVQAMRVTGARMVDVSSGVETGPGKKDPRLISRFLAAAKGAKQGA
jgi:phosphoribosylanthranilate isomerase